MAFFVKLNSRFRKILDLSIFPNTPGGGSSARQLPRALSASTALKHGQDLNRHPICDSCDLECTSKVYRRLVCGALGKGVLHRTRPPGTVSAVRTLRSWLVSP